MTKAISRIMKGTLVSERLDRESDLASQNVKRLLRTA